MSDQINDETLTHYGVPGMKWGHRKQRTSGSRTSGKTSSTREKLKKTGEVIRPAAKALGKATLRVGAIAALTAIGVPAIVAGGTVAATIAANPELVKAGKDAIDLWMNDAGLKPMSQLDQLKAQYNVRTTFREDTISR
jgi:hypothetical protein